MISYIRNVILSDERMIRLFDKIMEKDRYYWKRFNTPDEIFRWLNNFLNENEMYLALLLADKIIYYSMEEVRYLWKLVLNNRFKRYLFDEILKQDNTITSKNINSKFLEFVKERCIFIGFGGVQDTAANMVYPFRQSLSSIISEKDMCFMDYLSFINNKMDLGGKKVIFLLDDFIGTGNQAVTSWKEKITVSDNYKDNQHIRYLYLALAGFSQGVENIEKNTDLQVLLGTQPMGDNFRCFSNGPSIYEDVEEREMAKRIMESAGRILYEHPLGYKNSQAAVAFYHNTPNNTLPVIWKKMNDGSWYPLFERFE